MPRLVSIREPRRLGKRAFTLIEVMVVVAILGIAMAVTIPSFARIIKKEGMRKAVSDIVEACGHARTQAIITGAPTELIFDTEGGISVRQASRAEPRVDEEPQRTRRQFSGFTAQLPDTVAYELLGVNFIDHVELGEEARVRFYPNGTSDEFTVVLLSTENERRKISLDIITALAEVERDPSRFLLR